MGSHLYRLLFVLATANLLTTSCEEADYDFKEYKTFGDAGIEEGHAVVQTSDGGYIIAGGRYSLDTQNSDVFVVKTDLFGDTLWTRTFGGDAHDIGHSVQQTQEGGFVIAGVTLSFGDGALAYLIKIDTDGNAVWSKTFGGSDNDRCYAVQQTSDGGYVLAGSTTSFGNGHNDVWLIKTDSAGGLVWQRTYGGEGYELSSDVKQTEDGGLILVGSTGSTPSVGTRVWLIKTDATGDTLWTRTYGDSLDMQGDAVYPTDDGGYIIAGRVGIFNRGRTSVLVIKTDTVGDTLWTRSYAGSFPGWAEDVRQTIDGGYIVTGYSLSFDIGDYSGSILLLKLDASGTLVWGKPIQGDVGRSVIQIADEGFVVTGGVMGSIYPTHSDMLLIKTNSNGVTVPLD